MVIKAKTTFADRLNMALDSCAIPKKGSGRQTITAKMFGVSQTSAWKWLEGTALPNTKRIQEIATKLNVSGEWLLTGRGPMQLTESNQMKEHGIGGMVSPESESSLAAYHEQQNVPEQKAHEPEQSRTMGERIKFAMEYRSKSLEDIVRAIDTPKQVIDQLIKGSSKEALPLELLKIADYLRFEIRWLIDGKGAKTCEEAEFLRLDLSEIPESKRPTLKATYDAFKELQLNRASNGTSSSDDES